MMSGIPKKKKTAVTLKVEVKEEILINLQEGHNKVEIIMKKYDCGSDVNSFTKRCGM